MFYEAYYVLCSKSISQEQLVAAKQALHLFVDDFQDLFGEINMVFNVHLFRHLADSVKMNGPLYTHSAYNMESNIGHIMSTVHGPTDVIKQCTEKYLLERDVNFKLEHCDKARDFYNRIRPSYHKCNVISKFASSAREHLNGWIAETEIKSELESIVVNGDFYRANVKNVRKNIKTNDSLVVLKSGEIGIIYGIFVLNDDSHYILFMDKFSVCQNTVCSSINYIEEKPNPAFKLIRPSDIGKKSIFISYDDKLAYSMLPNNCESD